MRSINLSIKSKGWTQAMNLNDIINYCGQRVQYNKTTATKYQCVDFVKFYCDKFLGIYDALPELKKTWAWGNAKDWAIPNTQSKKFFDFLKPGEKLKKGDIIVFSPNSMDVLHRISDYGHIAVYMGIDTKNRMICIEQNYPNKTPISLNAHNKSCILKILRIKGDA